MNKKNFIRFCIYLVPIFISCICIGYSQDITKYSQNLSSLEVSVNFYNKEIYYIGNPIVIEFQIVNNGNDPFLFITSYNKLFTFDFEISSFSNQKVEHSKNYVIKRRQFQPILNDEISLKQNEVYGVRINISEWFEFIEAGDYIIKGVFYPNLITDTDKKIYSEKELYVYINPPYTEALREKVRIEEIRKLKAESLPPYEVVEFILNAFMEKDYEKYLLYIKMDKFIMQFDSAEKKYLEARDIDKPDIIEIFKQYLMGRNTLESIPFAETIPTNYDIDRTVIEKREAQVTVTEYFEYGQVTEIKRYTYHLHLYGDKWLVENYDVVNIQ
jgi:hypothetical protein